MRDGLGESVSCLRESRGEEREGGEEDALVFRDQNSPKLQVSQPEPERLLSLCPSPEHPNVLSR